MISNFQVLFAWSHIRKNKKLGNKNFFEETGLIIPEFDKILFKIFMNKCKFVLTMAAHLHSFY